ncbi:unnamed protein product, partial [Prorocentrum cordatum]
ECEGRRVLAIKIKSHESASDAVLVRRSRLEHWVANFVADKLADQAAKEAQLPRWATDEVERIDKLSREVQEHILTISHFIAVNSSQIYGASTAEDRKRESKRRRKAKQSEIAALTASTSHCLVESPGKPLKCSKCLTSPTGTAESWLRMACPGLPAKIHFSHRHLQRFRGVFWCRDCGSYSATTFNKLSKECSGIVSKHGGKILRALEAGKLPRDIT